MELELILEEGADGDWLVEDKLSKYLNNTITLLI